METIDLDTVFALVEQLTAEDRAELLRRLETQHQPQKRPSSTLRVFHVERFPSQLTLRREDEYGDDER